MSFITRHLDPAEILGELLFGLIMVLTFTLGASVAGGYERGILLAAIGCNVAWGVIDGVLVVMANRYARRRRGRLLRVIHAARDENSAIAAIRDEFEFGVSVETQPEDRARLYRSVHDFYTRARVGSTSLTLSDLATWFAVFLLVVGAALPAVLPFLVISDPHVALRASNALLIVMLFAAGWRYGRHIDMQPWLAGLVLTAMGVGLVALAIALGG